MARAPKTWLRVRENLVVVAILVTRIHLRRDVSRSRSGWHPVRWPTITPAHPPARRRPKLQSLRNARNKQCRSTNKRDQNQAGSPAGQSGRDREGANRALFLSCSHRRGEDGLTCWAE